MDVFYGAFTFLYQAGDAFAFLVLSALSLIHI